MPRSKSKQEVLDAAAAALKAKPTDAMPAIALLIQRLSADPKAYPKEFIAGVQALLLEQTQAPLAIDGVCGPRTTFALTALWELLQPKCAGAPMFIGGIATHFGGPDDAWDRYNGQAFFPPAKSQESPADYYARVPVWVQNHLRLEMANDSKWPTVTDEKGVRRPAGVSYYLTGLYAALRLEGDIARAAREGRVYVEVVNAADPSRAVVARVTDYGPHPRVSATIDLAPTAYRVVAAKSARVLFRLGVRPVLVEGD